MDLKVHQVIRAGLEAKNYRDFLQNYIKVTTKPGKKFNFAAFSRKAGFTSRGFIKEVLDGRKRLTSLSFPKVLKALTMPTGLRQYFNYLVILEEPDLNHDKLTQAEIRQRMSELSEKLRARLSLAEQPAAAANAVFKSYQVLEVYSVLGDRNKGIPISEVQRRTSLDLELCKSILKHLLSTKVVALNGGNYRSQNPHLIFDSLGTDQGFKKVYLDTLDILKRKATARFSSQDDLFYQSYFSVERHRLPELKKRLRETLTEFVESSENNDGDCVSKLIIGMFH